MKHGKTFLGFMVCLCAAILFLGCPTEAEDNTNYGVGEPKELDVTVTSDTILYYSLTTGLQVTDPASKNWDIAFGRSNSTGGLIYTNSGATAAAVSSQGTGGVRITTEKKEFASVSNKDGIELTGEYEGLEKDSTKYIDTNGDNSGEDTPFILNVMTYLGYAEGSGDGNSKENPYKAIQPPSGGMPPATYLPYTYDKRQYFKMTKMIGGAEYETTDEVYIIQHGNGTGLSKIQVTEYGSSTATGTTFKVKYQNF
ncbi:MAG: hypothetical protein LBP74_00665 [Treponema sp.]|jgi:hypothetical protein|nr:hypothetical protein [Treponema sp.]